MANIPKIQVGTDGRMMVVTPVLVVAIGPDGQPLPVLVTSDGKIKVS